ncbi:hypothetical protein C8039_05665 [Halogeometricum sp. wsp3]|nr:hypothetical protein C8039_05665 [Halogeometricum sp. wsp3]
MGYLVVRVAIRLVSLDRLCVRARLVKRLGCGRFALVIIVGRFIAGSIRTGSRTSVGRDRSARSFPSHRSRVPSLERSVRFVWSTVRPTVCATG